MRTLNKDNVQKVVDTVFAHTQVRLRNILITLLLDNLWTQEPRMTKDIKQTLLGTISNKYMIFSRDNNKNFFFG